MMNRVIKYRGKTIKEMTLQELENQYKFNKTRLLYRTLFFIIVALGIIVYEPIAMIIPISFAIITGYWLMQNNQAIKEEIEYR